MKKKALSVLLSFMICMVTAPTGVFAETTEESGGMTRGEWMHELVSIFQLTLEKEEYPDVYFPDIPDSKYFDDIMVATKNGLVNVEAGDDFRPDDPLTREFAVQTVNYKLGIINEKSSYTYSDTEDVTFRDDAQVAVDQGWVTLIDGKSLTVGKKSKLSGRVSAIIFITLLGFTPSTQ